MSEDEIMEKNQMLQGVKEHEMTPRLSRYERREEIDMETALPRLNSLIQDKEDVRKESILPRLTRLL